VSETVLVPISFETEQTPELYIDDLIAFPAGSHLFTVIQLPHLDTYRTHALAAHQHHIRPRYRGFAFNDAPLAIFGGWTGMSFDDVNVLDKDSILLSIDSQDFTNLAFVFTGNDFYFVIFFYMTFVS
jgi:hypothetical protein